MNLKHLAHRVLEGYLERLLGREPANLRSEVPSNSSFPKALESVLRKTADELKGQARRTFLAQIVEVLGRGGQRWAQDNLLWNRGSIRKGRAELRTGLPVADQFSKRGRKKAEVHLEHLLDDIKAIVDPVSQADPTFRTSRLYIPITANSVRQLLIENSGYSDEALPGVRALATKLNELGYYPQKVAKSKPFKKIPETDAIFEKLHELNRDADQTPGVLRLSMDAKATIKVGPFSRGGRSRRGEQALDHDFKPDAVLGLFGVFVPAHAENYFCFTESKVTADFMVDALECIWPKLDEAYHPHTLVLNLDNGPENHSHRTQFIKRTVDFAQEHSLRIMLLYYPPYHSKYNPIERVWGRLENHWNGELLDSVDKVFGLASTMKWKGNKPEVVIIEGEYATGAKLSKPEMKEYEKRLIRLNGLEKYSVDIPVSQSSPFVLQVLERPRSTPLPCANTSNEQNAIDHISLK